MDHIRSCYRSQMRLYRDRPDVLVTGDWHFCAPGAKVVPYIHAFGSSDWDDYRLEGETPRIGETGRLPGWNAGTRPKRFDGVHYCGSADVWANGVVFGTPPLPVWSDGLPRCCNPNPPPVEIDLVGELALDGSMELLEMVGELALDGNMELPADSITLLGELALDGNMELPADSITLLGELALDGNMELPADSITLLGELALDGLQIMAQTFSGVLAPASVAGLPDNTLTAVIFGAPDYDTDGYWSGGDPARLTAPVEGWYHATAFASFEADATGQRGLSIWLNGSTLVAQVIQDAATSGLSALDVSADVFLSAGDWIEVDLYQSSGSTLDVTVKGWMHLVGV